MWTKTFHRNFLVANFYGCKIISSEIGLNQKFPFIFFWLNFLLCQNHFRVFRFEPKICIEVFWTKIFYGCKIISWGIGVNQIFSSKVSGRKFLLLQNHLPGERTEPKIFIEIFWSQIFYGCKIISTEIGLNQQFPFTFFFTKFCIVSKSFPRV